MRALGILLFAVALRADERTQKLAERLAAEAQAFEKLAPEVMGRETLRQRTLIPPARFKVRVGAAAEQALPAVWRNHEIVSQYGFAVFGGSSIHELRQVTAVDGKRVAAERRAQEDLAKLVTSNDEERKKRALQQLEKYGLRGGATDFGQLLLLFSRANLERYEITYAGPRMVAPVRMQAFRYKQLDGPEAVTVFERGQTQRLSVEGEIWVREADGVPVRVTMVATGAATGKSSENTLREEATVDYAVSEFGPVLPFQTTHRELRGGEVVTENTYRYDGFHRLGVKPAGEQRR